MEGEKRRNPPSKDLNNQTALGQAGTTKRETRLMFYSHGVSPTGEYLHRANRIESRVHLLLTSLDGCVRRLKAMGEPYLSANVQGTH